MICDSFLLLLLLFFFSLYFTSLITFKVRLAFIERIDSIFDFIVLFTDIDFCIDFVFCFLIEELDLIKELALDISSSSISSESEFSSLSDV